MNFIYINSDSFRRDNLGCYGNKHIQTPNIDRFADRSLVFDRAYTGSFPTVPNRRDLFTGKYTLTYTDWAALSPQEVVLSEVLGKAGYTSYMVLDTPHIVAKGFYYDRGFSGWKWIRGQEGDPYKTDPTAGQTALRGGKTPGRRPHYDAVPPQRPRPQVRGGLLRAHDHGRRMRLARPQPRRATSSSSTWTRSTHTSPGTRRRSIRISTTPTTTARK